MAQRSYEQFCGIAKALDVLGERWTLLVLRELLTGPKRFKDLLDALPGISTGLLTARLRALEAEEVVARRKLPPPAASSVYELTPAGDELRPVLLGLARWGIARLGSRDPAQAFRARWAMNAIDALDDPDLVGTEPAEWEFVIGDETFWVEVQDGALLPHDGPAHRPDMRLVTDRDTFCDVALAADRDTMHQAIRDGAIKIDGPPEAVLRFGRVVGAVGPKAAAGVPSAGHGA